MPDRGLGGRVRRGSQLARTGLRGATGAVGAQARRIAGRDDDPEAYHAALAEDLVQVLGQMKGAAMKVGQLLSFVDLDLPPEIRSIYHEALASLRDDAPTFDPDAIEQVLAETYARPIDEVFDHFEREPLASASIGQVHGARLADGRDVVVKVQYPGVAEAVRADLANATAFAPLARLLSPNQEVEPLLDELRERIDDELDYVREAQYQRAFAERYRAHPFIRVPEVVPELCGQRVLVSERIEGERFDGFIEQADEADRQRVGEIIFRYAYGSIGRFRLFNGDPHPGNYLIEPGRAADGGVRVAFLDYGSVKMFSRSRFASMRLIEEAVATGDRDRALEELRRAGFIPRQHRTDEDRVFAWFQLYTRPVLEEQPFTFSSSYAAQVIRTSTDPRNPFGDVLRQLNLPADYLLLTRIQWGLYSVLGRLGAHGDWRAIREEYLRSDAPAATPLGALDADWWAHREAPRVPGLG